MKEKFCHQGQQHLRYNLNKWVKKGTFDILDDISDNVTLVPLTNTLEDVNHGISIVGYCISESNYEKALHLTRE